MDSRHPETILPLSVDRNLRHRSGARKVSDASAQKISVCAVCLCALMCVGVVVYMHLEVKALSNKLTLTQDELAYIRQMLAKHQIPDWPFNSSRLYKRNVPVKPSKRQKKKPHVPPFIHLFGKYNGRSHKEMDFTYFTWDKAKLNPGLHGFELEGNLKIGYYKIKVKHQGVYLVYAQVAVNGRNDVNKPHECSHDTVCTRANGERIVLLSSLVTQYGLGEPYERDEENKGLRALDTKLHMGVFMLMVGDELSVQIPNNCDSMEYSATREHSYFGLAKLDNIRMKISRQDKE